MEQILQLVVDYEIGVYIILGFIILINLKRLFDAWLSLRKAKFGLEKEISLKKLRASVTIIVLFFLLGTSYFLLVSITAIQFPGISRLATPTINPLAENETGILGGMESEITPESIQQTQTAIALTGCIPDQLEWIKPASGDQVSGSIELIGTVNVENMGFYKYEYQLQGDDIWTPISAGNKPILEEAFGGIWNTQQLQPGIYLLRIVVSDNQNQLLQPCVIEVQITPE